MNVNSDIDSVELKAPKQKKSNKTVKPAKKSTIIATTNANNDIDAVKSKATKQIKINKIVQPPKDTMTANIPIRNSNRSPRIILNRISSLDEYNMMVLKQGKENYSPKHKKVVNNESTDELRRSKRKRPAMETLDNVFGEVITKII